MAFNLALLKEHPYATGGIVLVGCVAVYYLMSSGSSSSTTSSGSSDYDAALAADTQLQQTAAAASVQTAAQQAALQQTEIQAQVANTQTAADLTASDTNTYAALVASLAGDQASVSENATNVNGTTQQQLNQEMSNDAIYGMQEGVIEDQYSTAASENANNNATSLSELQAQLNTTQTVDLAGINSATQLASQQATDAYNLDQTIIPMAGEEMNSGQDATDQTSIFQTILSGGNASVATAGTNASSSVANAGVASNTAFNTSLTSGLTSLAAGLLG